jgi:hypothetical protein
MRYLCLLLLITLAACSYTTYLTGADEHGGTVNLVTELNKDGAIEKANEHCHNYNGVARVTGTDPQSNTLTFICEPSP